MHDHGPAVSPDASSPAAEACLFTLVELPCGCQDVHYSCGYTDREHDHVDCTGSRPRRGRSFSEWAAEHKARQTPAQAELYRRFAEAIRASLDQEA